MLVYILECFSIYLNTDPIDGQDYIQFLNISTNYTGLVTDTDDGCSRVVHISNGLPFGAATQTFVHVSLTSCSETVYSRIVTEVCISLNSKRSSAISLR